MSLVMDALELSACAPRILNSCGLAQPRTDILLRTYIPTSLGIY
jgi:hypothetical protein